MAHVSAHDASLLLSSLGLPRSPRHAGNFIAGAEVSAPERARIAVRSPYTGTELGSVPDSGPREVDAAVQAARVAQRAWAAQPVKERSQVLLAVRARLQAALPELGRSAARECGKTLAEAEAGVLKGIEVLDFALSLQNLDQGGALTVSRGVSCEVRREPLGVVAGITPFNFPAMVPLWMIPLALVTGNAFVLKPSEKVPFTALALAELAVEAGLPPGLLSVVNGGQGAVEALIAHPDVSAYGFVGSSRVAKQVYVRAASEGKRVLALGGAKNPMILMPDADPELAAAGVVASFTGCAGQRCMAGSVLLAVGQGPDTDALVARIAERAQGLVLGRDMGALIDGAAEARLRKAIADGVAEGARILVDGRTAERPDGCEAGHFLGPTILDHVSPSSYLARDELFGPVLSVVRVPDLSTALSFEASGRYGNALSVFTGSGAVARRVQDEATSGMVGINVGVPVPREPFSFGGTKGSRFGHGDVTGVEGVSFWTQLKKVTTKWAEAIDRSWMS
jgi:malonate-semialdehyde dehydrogenase (acetylating) / methylmalonate-semialdehyde dehydrogenase